MMSLVHELTSADLRRSRLHIFWIQLLFTLVVGLMVVAEFEMSPDINPAEPSRFPLGSFPYLVVGLQVTVFALVVAIWLAPVLTLIWMVPVAWLLPLVESAVPTGWRAVAVACLVVLVSTAWRSRKSWTEGPRRRVASQGPFELSWAFRDARMGWLAVAGGLILAAGLLVAHHVALLDVRSFEERASREVAEVVGYDEEYYEMDVRFGDRVVTIDEGDWVEQPAIGDMVPVLVDPEDPEHVSLVASMEDPSWLFGLAVVAPLAGLWFGLPIIRRARRRRELVARGAPATMILLSCSEEGDFTVAPTDGGPRILQVAHLDGLVPREDVQAFINDWEGRFEESADDLDEDEPQRLPESDAVLADWADEMKELSETFDDDSDSPHFPADMPEDEKLMAEADFGPDVRGGEPFVLLGSWRHGSTVALLRSSGQVWLAEIKEPRFRTGDRPRLQRGSAAASLQQASPRRGVDASTSGVGRVRMAFSAWTSANSRWLRWLVAVVAAGLGALLTASLVWVAVDDGGGFFAWIRPVLLGLLAMTAPVVVTDWISPATTGRARPGIASYGLVMDEVVASDRLVSVVAGENAVAVRLRDPDDALAVFPEDVGQGLDPEGAAQRVRSWFATAPAGGRSRHVPSPILVAGVLQVVLTGVFVLWFVG